MDCEMAYLLGMICGNGEVKRENNTTLVVITIPHKKLKTEDFFDIRLYVKASVTDIRNILEPLVGADLNFAQEKSCTYLSFRKQNNDYLMREILRMIGASHNHINMRIPKDIFNAGDDERKNFLKGFADVTGYIRRSNYHFKKCMHRVYIEISNNWEMVIDICNLLKNVDIPVQNINWAHPNMRDGRKVKFNEGKPDFWKKEHQIKIWANEFLPVGFAVLHKQQALEVYAKELEKALQIEGKKPVKCTTHKYYWEGSHKLKRKPKHPGENDLFLPKIIRGKHYNSWRDIAKDLGYAK